QEKIELYTSAFVAADGFMRWNDGDTWTLVVHREEQQYPLLNERIQNGEVDFWVIKLNSKELDNPAPEDVTTGIYVAVTSERELRILCFTWDEESRFYTEEIAFTPPHSWAVRHANKYVLPLTVYAEERQV
ncbi:MAG: hypothetical protein LBT22_05055, partial [Peptococcaceae bacterium]|nr:hypothetical protein [Peptococcaceae bacterium]